MSTLLPDVGVDRVIEDDFVESSTVFADGESSASAGLLSLMSGCLMVSSSSWNDEEPSSMSRSCSIRGDIFLHMVVVIAAVVVVLVLCSNKLWTEASHLGNDQEDGIFFVKEIERLCY